LRKVFRKITTKYAERKAAGRILLQIKLAVRRMLRKFRLKNIGDRKLQLSKNTFTSFAVITWDSNKKKAKLKILKYFRVMLQALMLRNKVISTFNKLKILQNNVSEWFLCRRLRLDILHNLSLKMHASLKKKIR